MTARKPRGPLTPGFDPADASTVGLKLVSSLAGQLGGRLETEASPGGGAAFKVVFPTPKGAHLDPNSTT